MGIVVRAGTADDVDRCVDLWTRVISIRDGESVAPVVAARTRAAFARPVVRFAVTGSTPTGFALTVTKDQHSALLSRVCVDPLATSHGLGAALLADATTHARTNGYERLDLDVRRRNTRAIALYSRTGFHPVSDPWPHDDGDLVVTCSRRLTDHEPR